MILRRHHFIASAMGLALFMALPVSAAVDNAVSSPESAEAIDAEALFAAQCGTCHNGRVSKAPPVSMLANFSPSSVLRAMNQGVMQSQAKALTADERVAVAEFITGRALSENLQAAAPSCEQTDLDMQSPPKVVGWGVDLNNRRFFGEELTTLTLDDLPSLELAWAFAFPDASRVRSQPTVAGDSIFIGSQTGDVRALDRETGCVRWTFSTVAEVRTGIVVTPWQAGDTEAQPLAFFGDLIGNVYALNARTGELVWRDRPEEHPSLTITATPALHEGTLYVALSSLEVTEAADPAYACCTFRGGVAAYDAATGAKHWTGYTIDEAPKVVAQNALGTDQLAPSGAPVWGTPVIDPARNRLYVGTGESYSSPAGDTSDALLALSLDDGSILWQWQATPGDAWNMACETEQRLGCPPEDGPDYDFGAATLLATTSAGRDILVAGQKSGEVFGLNPDTGEVLWRNKLGRGGIQGGVHFGMSVDGDVLYVPMSDFYGGPRWPGTPYPGMFALNVGTGETLWYTPTENVCDGLQFCDPGLSAASSAIRGGTIGGALDGRLRAYDRDTGEVVWEFNALQDIDALGGATARGGSFSGASGPVFDGDMLFVTSGYGIYFHMPGNALLAFKRAAPSGE